MCEGLATKCILCTTENKLHLRLNETLLEIDGKLLTALDALQIFNEIFAVISKEPHHGRRICIKCSDNLKSCYLFVHRIQLAQRSLVFIKTTTLVKAADDFSQHLSTQQQNVSNRKQRILLPKVTVEKVPENAPPSKTTPIKRVYKCHECPQSFSSFRQLKLHETTHELKNISICNLCCSLFANAEALEKHKQAKHADENYVCLPCTKTYKNKGHLLKHISDRHQRHQLIYYCSLCPAQTLPAEYDSRLALHQHFQEVHLLMPNDQDEDDDVEIEMNEEFLDEFLLRHGNENSFQFSESWEELDLHLPDVLHLNAQQHTDNANGFAEYKCPKCYEQFNNQKTFLAHLAKTHALSLLICSKCEASFVHWEELRKHKATHRLHDTFESDKTQCKICDRSFKSNAALNYHIKTHSRTGVGQHRCPYCSKEFQAYINLKQHLRIVHSQLKKHICLLCDKQFSTLDHLKKHVLSQHQNERKYSCQVCLKRFTQICHLKQHMEIHTTGKTLHCAVCNASFWRKIDLERHILAKHEQKTTTV